MAFGFFAAPFMGRFFKEYAINKINMKKLIFLSALALGLLSCSKDDATTVIPQTQPTAPVYKTVSTFAGTTNGYLDGTGTAAQFSNPQGMTIDASGNLYICDFNNYRIRKITPTGVVTTIAGNGNNISLDGTGTAAQVTPNGITIDNAGNIYFTESFFNNKIRKITPAGVVTTIAGSTEGNADGTGTSAQFYNPRDIVLDKSGNLYVADSGNHKIRKITPAGVVTTIAGSTNGYADGTGSAAQFSFPFGITIDNAGNLYVADTNNHKIRKITPSGVVTTIAGNTQGFTDGTGTAAQFNNPTNLKFDRFGNLFISDSNNNRIRKMNSNGNITTITGSSQGFVSGAIGLAQFYAPRGLAFDTTGNLFVVDSENHNIRKITP